MIDATTIRAIAFDLHADGVTAQDFEAAWQQIAAELRLQEAITEAGEDV